MSRTDRRERKRIYVWPGHALRLQAPVLAGARVRGGFDLTQFRTVSSGVVQTTWDVVIESEGRTEQGWRSRVGPQSAAGT